MADRHAPRNDLLVSLHIPKTAGTYFGTILKRTYGDACALYYGAASERTHPLLRVRPSELTADRFDALAEAGVKIVHGHLRARYVSEFMPDPARYYVILREPIEQTISHYYYQLAIPQESRIGRIIKEKDLALTDFTSIKEVKNYQASFLKPFALEDFGFVGVTELMRDMLPLLGLKDVGQRSNENRQKPMADLATRQQLVRDLAVDLSLYSQAMELAIRRIGARREPTGARLTRRLVTMARRRGGTGVR